MFIAALIVRNVNIGAGRRGILSFTWSSGSTPGPGSPAEGRIDYCRGRSTSRTRKEAETGATTARLLLVLLLLVLLLAGLICLVPGCASVGFRRLSINLKRVNINFSFNRSNIKNSHSKDIILAIFGDISCDSKAILRKFQPLKPPN